MNCLFFPCESLRHLTRKERYWRAESVSDRSKYEKHYAELRSLTLPARQSRLLSLLHQPHNVRHLPAVESKVAEQPKQGVENGSKARIGVWSGQLISA